MSGTPPARPKVCYIGGWGRSGSSILGKVLGQYEGFADVGETQYLWWALGQPEWRCGCGDLLAECSFWQSVMATVAATEGPLDLSALEALGQRSARLRRVGTLWRQHRRPTAPAGGPAGGPAPIDGALGHLYRAIAHVSGARVIIDTSKTPSWALIASGIPDVDLHVVHLVRDPRAVAHSWSRSRPSPGGIAGDRQETCSTSRSALHWMGNNLGLAVAERDVLGSSRYLRVRYEDFVAAPEETVRRILAFLDEDPVGHPFENARRVRLAPTHNACGNPSRFRVGPVELTPDEEWRTHLPRRDRRLTVAIAGLAMPSMGYRLTGSRGPG